MAFRKIEAGLVHADVENFIGRQGTIFYDNDQGDFRISDGVTPGGIALSFGGGGGYVLPTATTTVKGGVKVDGSTITIANQIISVGSINYDKISNPPSIPTNTNQLTNGAGFITNSALSGYATETFVTTRGYLTSVSWNDVQSKPTLFSGSYTDLTDKPTIPTNNNQLTNGAGYITSSSLSGYATETFVTTRGYLTSVSWNDVQSKPSFATVATSGSYTDLINKPTIPSDISQLTDTQGLLGQGGGGGTTVITNNIENPYAFSVAGDDSTLREISNGETLRFAGATGITVTSDAEGKITITGPDLSSYATQSYVTTQGYITSSALTGYATETFVTTRGYLTTVDYSIITNRPTLSTVATSGSYTDLINLPSLFSGSYNDLTNKPSIPDLGNIIFSTTTIDSSDSSSITFTPAVSFNSDITVENDLIVANQIRSISGDIYVTESFVTQAVNELIGAAPQALNTLQELAAALGNDQNFATTILNALAAATNTVRFDINNQGLSDQQKQNARTNIGAISEADMYAAALVM